MNVGNHVDNNLREHLLDVDLALDGAPPLPSAPLPVANRVQAAAANLYQAGDNARSARLEQVQARIKEHYRERQVNKMLQIMRKADAIFDLFSNRIRVSDETLFQWLKELAEFVYSQPDHLDNFKEFEQFLFERLKESRFKKKHPSLERILQIFSDEQIKTLLSDLVNQSEEIIVRCLDHITPAQFSRVYNVKDLFFVKGIRVTEKCALSLDKRQKMDAKIEKNRRKPAKNSIIDNLILAWSLIVDQKLNTSYDAMQMIQMVGLLVMSPFILTTMLVSIMPDWRIEGPTILAAVFSTLAVSVLIMSYLKRRHVPLMATPLRNYTQEALDGRFDALLCRENEVRKMIVCLEASGNPVLLGHAGVGKSAIFIEAARRIALNEHPAKSLHGKQVFGEGCSAFLATGMFNTPVQLFETTLGKLELHKKNVILAFDEIHLMFNEKNGGTLGEAVKPRLDTSAKSFPYVMAATTRKEYRAFIGNNPALARRFFPIKIRPTNKPETILILQEHVRRHAPDLIVPKQVLELTYDLTKKIFETDRKRNKTPKVDKVEEDKKTAAEGVKVGDKPEGKPVYYQPDISKRILSNALAHVRLNRQRTLSSDLLQQRRVQRDHKLSQFAISIGSKEQKPKDIVTIAVMRAEVKELKRRAEQDEKIRVDMEITQARYHKAQANLFQLSIDIMKIKREIAEDTKAAGELRIQPKGFFHERKVRKMNEKIEKKQTQYFDLVKYYAWIMNYLCPSLEKQQNEYEVDLSIPTLNSALIRRTITDFLKQEERNPDKPSAELEIFSANDVVINIQEQDEKFKRDGRIFEAIENGPIGLPQIRKGCPINAVLQILFNIPDIREKLEQISKEDPNTLPMPVLIRNILQETNGQNLSSQLQQLRNQIVNVRKSGDRQDAHEFLQLILNQLNWFPMQHYTHFEFNGVKHSSQVKQIHHLSVGLTSNSFQQVMNDYFVLQGKQAEGKNYAIHEGQRYKFWKQASRVDRLPPYLIVHLKRYDDNLDKIRKQIAFPENRVITIQQDMTDQAQYEIVGYVNHVGKSLRRGRYTANVKNIRTETSKGEWVHCDDAELQMALPADPESEAYIIALRRRETAMNTPINASASFASTFL